jgi:dTDP-4-dehydrorhamnose 3,5-epimerase
VIAEHLSFRGVVLLHSEDHVDDRGAFRRILDMEELASFGLDATVVQISTAINIRRGTVRGMHYQAEPFGESKTIWCSSGTAFDVLVDVRADEPTYGRWMSVELSAREPTALHVPRGIAHGYQTIEDGTSLIYLIGTPYVPSSARSIRWNDPQVGIEWPMPVTAISDRDREAPSWPPER